MTKVKRPYSHNGLRPPPASAAAATSCRQILGLRRPTVLIGRPSKGRRGSIMTSLVFISSLLICCSWLGCEGSQSALRSAAEAATKQQIHDSISDSSSSQPVSNLSPAAAAAAARSQRQPNQRQQSSESENNLSRLLVERDLSAAATNRRNHAPASMTATAAANDEQPANHNNNNSNNNSDDSNNSDDPSTPGEGPLNGDETESSSDDSSLDYETSDAPTEFSPVSSSSSAADYSPADSHARPSRQSVASPTTTTTTTTTSATTSTTRRPAAQPTTTSTTITERNDSRGRQFVSDSRGGVSLQQARPTEPTTFNVNMGSDRLLIKPHTQQQPTSATTMVPRPNSNTPKQPMTTTTTTTIRGDQEPRASESVNHEFITTTRNPHREHSAAAATNLNDRRQDLLLYPTNINYSNNNNNNNNHHDEADDERNRATTFMPRMSGSGGGYLSAADQDQLASDLAYQQQQQQQQSGICYTPFALLLVVLMTMLTTLLVCFCTHFLFKHLTRRNRQFDLVASSRQFDNKHALGSQAPASAAAANHHHWPAPIGVGGGGGQLQATSKQNNNSFGGNNLLSGLFAGPDHAAPATGRDGQLANHPRRDDEFAFDNPYFRDEQLRKQQQLAQRQQQAADEFIRATGAPPGGNEQMHFIQHHISNLHTRQVTSSVKELSALSTGANSNNQPAAATQHDLCAAGGGGELFQASNLVDLTSLEHRNKIIADPKEGDLIAVDITGHDFIGLGFDVCGSQHEGIFVSSLLARGPARESGCIEIGDRIKCLNISFENITLQDARDILNCGAPYQMRVLLEKRAAARNNSTSTTKKVGRNAAQTLLDNYRNDSKQQPIRACLRKLGNFVTTTRSEHDNQQLTRLNGLADQQQLALDYRREQQVGGAGAGNEWLGSAAARRQHALASPFVQGYLNQAFGGSENELARHQHNRGDTIDSACSVNLRSGRLSSIDSGGGGGDGQVMIGRGFGVDGRRNSSSQQPPSERADGSLEHFHDQNANHRLHGPGGNNLHLAMDGQDTSDDEHNDLSDTGGNNLDIKNKNNRRRRRSEATHLSGGHLEQTQSQPEIAQRSGSNLKFQSTNGPVSGRFDIDIHDRDNKVDDYHDQEHSHRLSSSISTPTMNLLPVNSTTGGGRLERRMSSRRRRKDDNTRATINEESTTAAVAAGAAVSSDHHQMNTNYS